MKTVQRYDSSTAFPGLRTPQGFLRVPVRATRTGVIKYRQPDGKVRRELRLPSEVFHPDSMRSLAGIPATHDHPNTPDTRGLLTPDNAARFMVGFTGDRVETEEEFFLATDVTVTDSQTIEDIESGRDQVSLGYTCTHDYTPGTYEGEAYDLVQRNIRYNHIAVAVPRARAGSEVRLKLDSDDAVQVDPNTRQEDLMKVQLKGKEFDASNELHAAIEAVRVDHETEVTELKSALEAAKAEAAKLTTEKATVEAKADSLDVEVKKLKAEVQTRTDSQPTAEQVNAAAKDRIRVLRVAEQILPQDQHAKLDSMSDVEIKKAVITAEDSEAKLDGRDAAYIDGRFDHIATSVRTDGERSNIGVQVNKNRAESAAVDAEAARKASMEADRNAWKGKTE